MNKDKAQERYYNNVKRRLMERGSCAVFRTGDKLHYTYNVSNVPELIAVYDATCPDRYIYEDAECFAT